MVCLVNREMISKMSQSAQGDIEKGQHVREQLVSTCYMIIHDWELTGSTIVIMGKILGESYPHAKGDGCRQSTSTGTMIHINDP